jgi:hypothetical protein
MENARSRGWSTVQHLWLGLVASLAAMAYIGIRAVTLGATYDEVSTIEAFVPESVGAIVTLTTRVATPDHILNTLLIKGLYAIGPDSLLLARLPNVLAAAIYLAFGYRLARVFVQWPCALAITTLWIANPFVLDFFSLARGYGLALAAQAMSMYYLAAIPTSARPRRAVALGLVAAAVSVLCVMSWLHFFMAACAVAIAVAFATRRDLALFAVSAAVLTGAALTAVLYAPVRRLQRLNMFFYGGDRNLYHDTLTSLAKYTGYSPDPTGGSSMALDALITMLLLAVIATLVRRSVLTGAALAASALLVLPLITIAAQHVLLGTLYPIDRAVLFLHPLAVLALCLAAQAATPSPLLSPMLVAAMAVSLLNVASHANLNQAVMWSFDAHTRRILADVNAIGAANQTVETIGYAWPFEQSLKYHWSHGTYPFVRVAEQPSKAGEEGARASYYVHLGRPLEKLSYEPSLPAGFTERHRALRCFATEAVCVYALP